jgi:hypothetical protein
MTMTSRARSTVFTILLAVLPGLIASASAGERMKHSGSIVAIADDGRTFVLAEVGPWQVRRGATVVTRRTITLEPETEFSIVAREVETSSGFLGDFVETRLGPDGVYLNDYVTVDCRHEGRRLIALKITVSEPWAEEAWSGAAR